MILYLPALFMFGGCLLTITVWCDVLVGLGEKYNVKDNFTIPKIISAIFVVVFFVVLFFICVVFNNRHGSIALYSNLLVIVSGVLLSGFVVIYLPLINKKFHKSQLHSGVTRISKGLLIGCFSFVLMVVFLIAVIALKAELKTNDPSFVMIYFLLQVGIRISELGMVTCVIYSTLVIPSKSLLPTNGNTGSKQSSPHTHSKSAM
eukprot:TRINITY_DN1557_c0_g1_i5.p1 TRINITY_DN1557_c0_g1~~TRINITY_DN1557_c0_g1_i5.p1  ORF type:complete len:204 (+),score=25.33 TRINITY_DN1557_c0_g1_i5:648-1259(+)